MGRLPVRNMGGRPGKSGARQLERLLKSNSLDMRTNTYKMLMTIREELSNDSGGWAALTGREKALVERSAAVQLICSSIENWCFKQENLLKDGMLPNVLTKSYISFVNTLRLNLSELGLRPSRPSDELSLESYLKAQKQNPPADVNVEASE